MNYCFTLMPLCFFIIENHRLICAAFIYIFELQKGFSAIKLRRSNHIVVLGFILTLLHYNLMLLELPQLFNP